MKNKKEAIIFDGTITFVETTWSKGKKYPHMDGVPVTKPNIEAYHEAGYNLVLNGVEFNSLNEFLVIFYRAENKEAINKSAQKLPKTKEYKSFSEAFPAKEETK